MVIVSSSWAPETYNSAPFHSALLRWARAGVTLGAIDTGAFILAEAGLLKGKRATTHYEHIDSLRELYVDTEASEDRLLMADFVAEVADERGLIWRL